MYQSADRQDFEGTARQIIERALYVSNPDAGAPKRQRSYSLHRGLVADVAKAAMKYALANGKDVDQFRDLAGEGIDVVTSLEYALTEHKSFDLSEGAMHEPHWNVWQHDDKPHVRIKAQNFPYMDRFGIEEAATNYLNLPYRAPVLERTLVDVLIALELYAYSKEMLEKPPAGLRWLSRSPLQQKHVLRRYIGGQIIGAIFFLGLAYLVAEHASRFMGQTAAGSIAGTLGVLWFLDLCWSTIMLPFAWRAQRKSKKQTRDLMISMAHTYAELNGDGQVSSRRLREVAVRAADAGVVWPKPLFLMLDDNIAHTGRL